MTLFKNFKQEKIETSEAVINIRHAGDGKPLLLLHGYPQTHVMWHEVAPELARDFHVICADLRGYGDSSKPKSADDHYTYSKRAMAKDMVEVMKTLGYEKFYVAGHDRGARVTHRMCLDFPEKVQKACVMDIAPTHTMFSTIDKNFATGYYHWFFLIQPGGLPERLIGNDPKYYLEEKIGKWSGKNKNFSKQALQEYIRCFSSPDTIHASCEDYRAAASIDLEHDEADFEKKIKCPLLVLWGNEGFVHRTYDVLKTWEEKAINVQGEALNSGHFLPEENPQETLEQLSKFFND
ncbi:MAG: alpha/beta hydrolase [Candidatus Dadabacteria bacterium]|nr:alpha/beta hydrolase [Candidatus Dadabacteria bacterium]NIS10197.1 alpha/beta hydrolase [Candidatus Dadabacteria bacterium]NIV42632.1 alpha/beta fold hydrolase [Candidatus Dadabacteria bacterium]NIX16563.1 alpha/beta fold hydrolase [Candidatus Dadabacteria bacterium]NIY23112.1 alpha/beta fold hydrolase [Candidatus Dadabacteria bacterium]